jgi:exopolysaccharide production protein ExoQ
MSPNLALALCAAFIFWVFRRDLKERTAPSKAVWIPALWFTVISARPLSYWLSLSGIGDAPTDNLEGSPIDFLVFLALMLAAGITLTRRNFQWGEFFRRNSVLILVYGYFVLSSTWADYSFPTLKRSIKDFGSVIVALVLLTEKDPLQALRIALVRVAYFLVPLSLTFIKWFPAIGTTPSRGGDLIFSGVCEHKSGLGELTFVLGLFVLCDLVMIHKAPAKESQLISKTIRAGFLFLCLVLLLLCKSVTSLLCLVLGAFLIWGTGRLVRLGNPAQMLFRCFAFLTCLVLIEVTFDVSDSVLALFGKNKTLTDRTMIWEMVLSAKINTLLGSGYYSFWESRAAAAAIEQFHGTLRTAHNGYIETYLDGGIVGLGLLIILLLVWGKRSIQRLLRGTMWGQLAFTFWLLSLLFNNSEASYFRLHPLWFTLVTVLLVCPDMRDEEPNSEEEDKEKSPEDPVHIGPWTTLRPSSPF